MRSYLDFEKPVAELEAKVEELRAMQAGGDGGRYRRGYRAGSSQSGARRCEISTPS